jgi:hypothetical protein
MKLNNWLNQHHEPPECDEWHEPDHYGDLCYAEAELAIDFAMLHKGITFADNEMCLAAEIGLAASCKKILDSLGE